MEAYDYDVLIVGSGFGGSVSALRLTEKGYRVGVLEAGRRFRDKDFPKNSWHLKDFLFAPKLGCFGIQRFHTLPDVTIMAGAGVGGGSLVYANTLYVPPKMFFDDPQWAGITDWATELAPYYDQAMRMLGVATYVGQNPSDVVMKAVADEMGVGHTYTNTPVGVFFGDGPGLESPDPYFGGRGPTRNGCLECGACCTGCRHNAKNTLPKNYLGLAEAAGATVHPMTTVTAIRPGAEGGYAVAAERTGPAWSKRRRTFTAEHVIVAAGTYNTQRLLHRMRDAGHLPNLSRRLGELTRTNSESVLGALTKHRDVDYTQGVAVTSSFHPDPDTHIQAPRYGKGSNLLGLLGTVLTDEESGVPRWRTWAGVVLSNPGDVIDGLKVRHWSERCMVIAAMQPLDNSLTVSSGRGRTGRWRLTSRQGPGEPNPNSIPIANRVAERVAEKIDGTPRGNIGEVFGAPLTVHFIGGAVIGADSDSGVIDPYHRVFGHPGLHVMDGAAITANLGTNPSLTITAQAERAMAMWPNKGERDARPQLGSAYARVEPVPPRIPFVPEGASGALRLPLIEIRSPDATAGSAEWRGSLDPIRPDSSPALNPSA